MGAELYGYFSDGQLDPPDRDIAPITECDECHCELYEGHTAVFVYIDEPLTFCSRDCLMVNIGATEESIYDEVADDEWV